MTPPDVAVVIVAYNSEADLKVMLPGLRDDRLDVLVVDNASADGSAEVAESHGARVMRMPRNSGWTAASNAGVQATAAPAIAFVNPDACPSPPQLLALARGLLSSPGVAPRFVDEAGKPQSFYFRFPRPLSGLLLFTNAGQRLDALLGRPAARRRVYGDQAEGQARVDAPGAACLVVDRTAFERAGGLDERFWLFFSDTDLCRRLASKGTPVTVDWDVCVQHRGGGSVRQMEQGELQQVLQRDYMRYADKHYSLGGRLLAVVGLVVLSGLLPAAASALRGSFSGVRAALARVIGALT